MLRRYRLTPSKGLGQHYLTAPWVYDRLLESCDVGPSDLVLEVGPGLGTLTRMLAERAGRVVAVELDRKLIPVLRDRLGDRPNVEIVQGDILALDPTRVMGIPPTGEAGAGRYLVVANLPYYITSSVLAHLLRDRPRPARMTLMVQRDVAERIVAGPGDLSLLALSVQVFGDPELVCSVPPEAFLPPPKVWSAILAVRGLAEPHVPEAELRRFFSIVRAGFGQKRKQLRNSLAAGLALPPTAAVRALELAGIDPQRRAQTLTIGEWRRLLGTLPGVGLPERKAS